MTAAGGAEVSSSSVAGGVGGVVGLRAARAVDRPRVRRRKLGLGAEEEEEVEVARLVGAPVAPIVAAIDEAVHRLAPAAAAVQRAGVPAEPMVARPPAEDRVVVRALSERAAEQQ